MSMAFGFCSVPEQYLPKILAGEIELHEMRWNDDHQYTDVRQESFEHYSMDLIGCLSEGDYALSDILFLADINSPLHELNGGLLYDVATVPDIVTAFAATDLEKLASDMGYPEADNQHISNSLFKNLQRVQALFEFAAAQKINVIGFII